MNIEKAEREIAKILAELEKAHGALVEGVVIESIEVTRMTDSRPQWHRRVLISMKPIPGSNWQT